MTYEELAKGLEARGFVGMDQCDSKGRCHKDYKHYILTTDGLIIYSNYPDWTSEKYIDDCLVEVWCFEWSECDTLTKEFEWWQLDEIMKI